jgi:hypothetical protein
MLQSGRQKGKREGRGGLEEIEGGGRGDLGGLNMELAIMGVGERCKGLKNL